MQDIVSILWGSVLVFISFFPAMIAFRLPFSEEPQSAMDLIASMAFMSAVALFVFSWGGAHVLTGLGKEMPAKLGTVVAKLLFSMIGIGGVFGGIGGLIDDDTAMPMGVSVVILIIGAVALCVVWLIMTAPQDAPPDEQSSSSSNHDTSS